MKPDADTLFTDRRSAGLLLHVTSLPSRFGIGDFGPAAYAWVDALALAKQRWWQVLPLNPPGAGHSPYSALSAFAGNPLLISPEMLVSDGFLAAEDLPDVRFPAERVAFGRVQAVKEKLLDLAWSRFSGARFSGAPSRRRGDFEQFSSTHASWLSDYALFMALRERYPDASWIEWPAAILRRRESALAEARRELADDIERHRFIQYLFWSQLDALRNYARERDVRLIGDIPIYVSGDSCDVWANPKLFQLRADRTPKSVAGVPPDLFSATGQRWGNPLFDWPAVERDDYQWWIARLRTCLLQADLVRIDHFRGLAGYWSIPAENPTAEHGRWKKGPSDALFIALKKALGGLPVIAEDLGVITPDVVELRDKFHLPGMQILHFAFGEANSPSLPHHHCRNAVVYTGTHDNDTTVGWFRSLSKTDRARLMDFVPDAKKDPAWALLRLAWSSVAGLAIAPLQDVFALGSSARMNRPGIGTGNWGWRFDPAQLKTDVLQRLADLTTTYGRDVKTSST